MVGSMKTFEVTEVRHHIYFDLFFPTKHNSEWL